MSTTPKSVRPLRKEWVIGEQTYEQKPFGLDRTALLLTYLGDLIERASSDPQALSALQRLQENTDDYRAIGGVLGALFKSAPATLVQLVQLSLDVHENPDKATTLARDCTPSQAMAIVETMVEQNDLLTLWQDFLALQDRIGQAFAPKK